ncbi:hypothetical protein [Actinacidiphila paucisporea]|uniref:Uncharacterized protein n=1 Tax=Actinacidiphila paucisporea TaxID=310782 RepID=A0A1M7M0L4_9ACTN|nr:hypothetical protein [Actinacidiphila paucisporea]SHM84166.1 hypothetical protein SAMN05216499_11545 [Actinacidiphila paucisporea]
MPHALSLLGRLRIERLVWALDQQLYDLPRASRVATRREVRANLVAAAEDVGVGEALRRLGGGRRLAENYLAAEFGEGPRHSWIAAAAFLTAVPLLLNYVLGEAASAFRQGITAHDATATGTFTWSGVSFLQSGLTFTFDQGRSAQVGGAWTPWTYLLLFAGSIACGRLWRLLPAWKARHRHPAVTS